MNHSSSHIRLQIQLMRGIVRHFPLPPLLCLVIGFLLIKPENHTDVFPLCSNCKAPEKTLLPLTGKCRNSIFVLVS